MRRIMVVMAGLVVLAATVMTLCNAALASDWKVSGKQYVITVQEYGTGSGNITGAGGVAYKIPYISVYDYVDSKQGAKLADIWGVCIDTRETVLTTPWVVTLYQGYRPGETGTVASTEAWNRLTWMTSNAAWPTSFTNDAAKAEFQLAAWELASGDTDGDFLAGAFTATNVVGNPAVGNPTSLVTAYNNPPTGWNGANSWFFHDHQDLLINTPQVPEIPAAALCPLGLAVVGLIKRRFVK